MKVALVGCGGIANRHAEVLSQLKHTLTVAIDSIEENAEKFKQQYGFQRASTNFEDALAADVDCVHICTPPPLHYSMVKQALNAGKHVLCEKPLCMEAHQAKEIMELALEKKLLAAVDFNVRYHEACQRAHDTVKSADFGRINAIKASYQQEFHFLPNNYMWRYNPEIGGKMRAVSEIGSHLVDLIRYWTGLEIIQVASDFGKFWPKRYLKDGVMYANKVEGSEEIIVDTEDVAVIMVRLSNGAVGSLFLSEISQGHVNCIKLEVDGDNKAVWWCSEEPYKLHTSNQFQGILTKTNAFGGGFPNTLFDLFKNFYDVMEGRISLKDSTYPTLYDGYKNVAVCDAIYKSAINNSIWTEVM
jgi:predicted dehydrogenase